jgi:RNA polymerase sigma factor (TIGR02999 family)
VTLLLGDVAGGDARARDVLLERLYTELRALAGDIFAGQSTEHTLQPTALVHEAYLKLVRAPGRQYESKRHFMAVAAKAMRQVLVNHAREKQAEKRGGTRIQLTLDPDLTPLPDSQFDVLDLEEALTRLERIDERQARIVELRFYGGLTIDETARVMEISESTVKREWRMARAELLLMLESDAEDVGA